MKGKVLNRFRKKPIEKEEIETQEPIAPEPIAKVEESNVKGWKVMNVPSQYEPAIVNQETEDVLDITSAVAKLLNDVSEIKQKLKEFEEGE